MLVAALYVFATLAAQLVSCNTRRGLPTPRLETRDDDTDDTDIYKRRALHSIMVMNDYLYIEGGEISSFVNGNQTDDNPSVPLGKTLSIPLGESWTNKTVTINEIDKDKPLGGNNIVLWSNDKNTTMYRWGGDGFMGISDLGNDVHLWAFAADGNGGGSWSQKRDSFGDMYSASSGAGASCGNRGYIVGGYASGSSDKRLNDTVFPDRLPLPGILEYDMSENTWTNKSTRGLNPPYGTYNSGRGVCVPGFADDSLLFVVGGDTTSRTSAARLDSSLLDLSNVTLYDPGNDEWYWQTAGGEIPSGREEFCAVGVAGNYTYDIYIYGGLDRTTGTLGDMYVLSLPGFQWFKLNTTGPPRLRHACALAGRSQMVVVGGIDAEWDWEKQDPWAQAIGILDLTTLDWSDKYDVDAPAYDSPAAVLDWYEEGNLGLMEWNNADVESWFYTTRNTNFGGSGGSEAPSRGTSSTPAGAIAGATVGAIAAVGLLGGAFWVWRRRRRAPPPGSKAVPTTNLESELDSKPAEPAHELEHDVAQRPSELAGSQTKPADPVELP